MARFARVVVPGIPHHVTQRGNRRQQTFFCDDDYRLYLDLMAEWCGKHGVEIWAYCLMTNHVHLIGVPATKEALGLAIGEAHRRYTRHVNFREGWRGYLWQGRFASFPMDDAYLMTAARYVEMNPVRAGMVARPEDYAWSSTRAHLAGYDDKLVKVRPLLDRIGSGGEAPEPVDLWAEFLSKESETEPFDAIRAHERTGRPLGNIAFIARLEEMLHRPLQKQKPGPAGAGTLGT